MNVTLVTVEGSKTPQRFSLRSEETIVGRREGCDLRIPSHSVSRRHCRLSFRDDLLSVEDLASANGTYVNGQRIAKAEILRPGDQLAIGPVAFLVEYTLTPAAEAKLADLAPPTLPDVEAAAGQEGEHVFEGLELKDEAVETSEGETADEFQLQTPRTSRKKPKSAPPAPSADSGEVMQDWEAPVAGDLRDILEQLGEGQRE